MTSPIVESHMNAHAPSAPSTTLRTAAQSPPQRGRETVSTIYVFYSLRSIQNGSWRNFRRLQQELVACPHRDRGHSSTRRSTALHLPSGPYEAFAPIESALANVQRFAAQRVTAVRTSTLRSPPKSPQPTNRSRMAGP